MDGTLPRSNYALSVHCARVITQAASCRSVMISGRASSRLYYCALDCCAYMRRLQALHCSGRPTCDMARCPLSRDRREDSLSGTSSTWYGQCAVPHRQVLAPESCPRLRLAPPRDYTAPPLGLQALLLNARPLRWCDACQWGCDAILQRWSTFRNRAPLRLNHSSRTTQKQTASCGQ